jgi:hypothetical protein
MKTREIESQENQKKKKEEEELIQQRSHGIIEQKLIYQ